MTVSPFSLLFDTTTLSNGSHIFTAIAKNLLGNQSTSAPITVTVSNSSGGSGMGPLTRSSNPRYFQDGTGKTIVLVGSHTWGNFTNIGLTDPPAEFDFAGYLDFMKAHHHNFLRLWVRVLPQPCCWNSSAGQFFQSPFPWQRIGPGLASDGKLRFDLTQFDPAYFTRLRQRVVDAQAKGIYVAVMMFEGFQLQQNRQSNDGYPLSGANNVNSIHDGYSGGTGGPNSNDLGWINSNNPAMLTIQETYVKKVIDTVHDLPNVLYEIADEAGAYSTQWQNHFIDFIHNYENITYGVKHPVGFTFQYDSGASVLDDSARDNNLLSSNADWISPRGPNQSGAEALSEGDVVPGNGAKVQIVDTDHNYYWVSMQTDGANAVRNWAWKNFMVGSMPVFMDPYLLPWSGRNAPSGSTPDPQWDPIRVSMGAINDYANKMNLAKMTPQGNLSSTGYCLADNSATGAEYLVYQSGGGQFTINLSATNRLLNIEWYNPSSGTVTPGGTVTGGSSTQSFTPPFSGAAVLYLVDALGHN